MRYNQLTANMSPSFVFIVNLIFVISILSPGYGKQCVGNGPCSCDFDDGSGTVDLTSLGTEGGVSFKDQSAIADGFRYNYNPCFPFTLGTGCTNVAVCQTDDSVSEFYNLGTQDTAAWSFDGANIQIYYSSTTEVFRETFVTAVCDADADEPVLTVTGEQTPQKYYLEIRSVCACAGGCSASGLSGGTILLIMAIALIVVYMVGGMAYNRYRNQKTGTELLPNREFWYALPGLIKAHGGRSVKIYWKKGLPIKDPFPMRSSHYDVDHPKSYVRHSYMSSGPFHEALVAPRDHKCPKPPSAYDGCKAKMAWETEPDVTRFQCDLCDATFVSLL